MASPASGRSSTWRTGNHAPCTGSCRAPMPGAWGEGALGGAVAGQSRPSMPLCCLPAPKARAASPAPREGCKAPASFCILLSDWIPRLFTTTVTTTTATTMAPATTRRYTTAAAATTTHVLRPDAMSRPSPKTTGAVSTKRPSSTLPATTRRKPMRQPPATKKPSRPCDSHPCLHGGTCEDDGKEFTCSCPAGKGGAVCEKRRCLRAVVAAALLGAVAELPAVGGRGPKAQAGRLHLLEV